MPKRVVFAAFVLNDDAFLDGGRKPLDLQDFTEFLGMATTKSGDVRDLMAWANFEDLLADHNEHGPITAEYVEGHANASTH